MRGGVFILLLLASAAFAKPKAYKAKAGKLKLAPGSQRASHRPVHRVGETLLGQPVVHDKGRLRVGHHSVKPGKVFTFRKIAVRFTKQTEGEWFVYGVSSPRFKLSDVGFRLIDVNIDGKFDLGHDGYLAYDSNVVVPLAKEFLLGRSRVRIESIAADGSAITADVMLLKKLDHTASQIEALFAVNRYRAQNGLPPVVLDDKLSKACEAHAEYLRVNHWSGFTDPHSQASGAKGASPEGATAARRSCIMKAAAAPSVEGFWRTYYHRLPLMSALLARVGINRGALLSVIDCAERDGSLEGWDVPVCVPCDRSVGLIPRSFIEAPQEPVKDLASRGTPLMMVFPARCKVTEFGGRLFEVMRKRDVEREVLVADPWRYRDVYGLVPARHLKGGTWYRYEVTYRLDGKVVERIIRFRTG